MKKNCLYLFILITLFSNSFVLAKLEASEFSKKNKYTFSISSVFRNEAKFLKEWIEYHRLVGAEHFYLYNNESSDDFQEVLLPYIQEGIVTLIEWPDQKSDLSENRAYRWVHATQETAFAHACKNVIGVTDWLAMIDLDEFILPMQANSFTEVLRNYPKAPGVSLLWHVYGTSWLDVLPENTLLIEALHMTFPEKHNINNAIMKSVVRPEYFNKFKWPPHECLYKDGLKDDRIPKKVARINHYMLRTKDTWKAKVENRKRSSNLKCSEVDLETLYNQGNDAEDEERAILRFAPQLRILMGMGCE